MLAISIIVSGLYFDSVEGYVIIPLFYICLIIKRIVIINLISNKSAKLTQNMPVIFVVNSMVMTTYLGAGYSAWRVYSAFGQFKGHNSGVHGRIWLVIELGRDIMPTIIFTEFNHDTTKTLT